MPQCQDLGSNGGTLGRGVIKLDIMYSMGRIVDI
jgi:hypothetical protein